MKKYAKRFLFVFKIHKMIPFLYRFFVSKSIPIKKKLLFVGAFLIYALFPFDIIPDFLTFFGIVDDITLFAFIVDQMRKQAPEIK